MKKFFLISWVIFQVSHLNYANAGFFDWLLGKPKAPVSLPAIEVGGSNYVFWSVGDYIGQWTEEAWRKEGNLKPVVGTFHENPDLVYEHLVRMYQQGQRKISLMLWYSPFINEYSESPVLFHMLNSNMGRLYPQQELNLRQILKLIETIGYNEVHIRFAQQWLADPSGWEQEMQAYESNAAFIFSTREIVESVLGSTSVVRIYDLGAELGGLVDGKHKYNPAYMHRLWMDYVTRYGADDTVGFSYALAPERVYNQYLIYNSVGIFPKYIALDVYGSKNQIASLLTNAIYELTPFKQQSTPVIVQEVYYNDAKSMVAIREAQLETGMNVKTIMQWPLSREGAEKGATHITQQFPEAFFNYLF